MKRQRRLSEIVAMLERRLAVTFEESKRQVVIRNLVDGEVARKFFRQSLSFEKAAAHVAEALDTHGERSVRRHVNRRRNP